MFSFLRKYAIAILAILIIGLALGWGAYYAAGSKTALSRTISELESQVSQLQKDVGSARGEIDSLTKALADMQGKPVEVVRQEIIKKKTQD